MQTTAANVFDVLSGKKNLTDFSFAELEAIQQFLTKIPTEWGNVRTEILSLMEQKAESFSERVTFAALSCRTMADLAHLFEGRLQESETAADLIRLFLVKNHKEDQKPPLALHLEIFREVYARGQQASARKNAHDNGFVEFFFCALNAVRVKHLAMRDVLEMERNAVKALKKLHSYALWQELFSFEKKGHDTALSGDMRIYDKISGGYILQVLDTVDVRKVCVSIAQPTPASIGKIKRTVAIAA